VPHSSENAVANIHAFGYDAGMPLTEAPDPLVQRLKALAHPARLQLLQLLAQPERFPQNLVNPATIGVCVNDLAKAAGLPQSTASHHLSILADAGLVSTTEHGPWRYLKANTKTFAAVADAVKRLAP
jgi:ArsR family transcriptional regulator